VFLICSLDDVITKKDLTTVLDASANDPSQNVRVLHAVLKKLVVGAKQTQAFNEILINENQKLKAIIKQNGGDRPIDGNNSMSSTSSSSPRLDRRPSFIISTTASKTSPKLSRVLSTSKILNLNGSTSTPSVTPPSTTTPPSVTTPVATSVQLTPTKPVEPRPVSSARKVDTDIADSDDESYESYISLSEDGAIDTEQRREQDLREFQEELIMSQRKDEQKAVVRRPVRRSTHFGNLPQLVPQHIARNTDTVPTDDDGGLMKIQSQPNLKRRSESMYPNQHLKMQANNYVHQFPKNALQIQKLPKHEYNESPVAGFTSHRDSHRESHKDTHRGLSINTKVPTVTHAMTSLTPQADKIRMHQKKAHLRQSTMNAYT
jgi:hypothetical protein